MERANFFWEWQANDPIIGSILAKFGPIGIGNFVLFLMSLWQAGGRIPKAAISGLAKNLSLSEKKLTEFINFLADLEITVIDDKHLRVPSLETQLYRLQEKRDAWRGKRRRRLGRVSMDATGDAKVDATVASPVASQLASEDGKERKGREDGKENGRERKGRLSRELEVNLPDAHNSPEIREALAEWVEHRRQKGARVTQIALDRQIKHWKDQPAEEFLAAIHYSVAQGWTGIFPCSKNGTKAPQRLTREQQTSLGFISACKDAGMSTDKLEEML